MRCHWIYVSCLSLGIVLTEVSSITEYVSFVPNETTERKVNSEFFVRQRRQIRKYDPSRTTPLNVAVELHMCTLPLPNEKKFCVINVKKLGYDHALIIDPSDHTNFIYPNDQGTLVLKQQQTVFLSCPGPNNALKNVPGSRASSNFSCICGSAFNAYNMVYDFHELTCQFQPAYEIVDKGFYGRESEYRRFEIGFYTDEEHRFLKVIDAHYDRATTSTMYVKSIVSRFIAGRQKPAKQDRYDQTHCCERQTKRLDMDVIYNPKTQDLSFAAQLYCHDSEFRTRCSYLSESSAVVFNRVQLSPKSSFMYTSAGAATFVYINTGPQWRPINDGNWARIEDHVIEMAKQLQKDLVVYTGVYDSLRLKDTGDNNREKMMFLYAGPNSEKSIVIPLYFWKLIYEPESKKGVVFVTLNNPYADRVENYHVCEKPMFSKDGAVMPKQWKPNNVAKGYSYMCVVADFVRSNAIVLHDFSAASVTDLLYLTKNVGNDSSRIDEQVKLIGRYSNKHKL